MTTEWDIRLSDARGRGGSVDTWSRVVTSEDAIPERFRDAVAERIPKSKTDFPYIVYAPPVAGVRRRTNERLIANIDGSFYIWESIGKQIAMTTFPIQKISSIEVGEVLLYSWLTISGLTSDGAPASSTVEFNTVTHHCFEPFIDRVRPPETENNEATWIAEREKFNYLESINYKFMNFARASLARGETVIDCLWQPQISRRYIALFGHAYDRTLSVTHLTILTDKEVVAISDAVRTDDQKGGQYGGVWHYFPLRHVVSVSTLLLENGRVLLSLKVAHGASQLERLYETAVAGEVERFRAAVEQRIHQYPAL